MRAVLIVFIFAVSMSVFAHGGRTNAQGCHNQKSNGTYHCHNGAPVKVPPNRFSSSISYANCAEARAAGVTPLRRGDPGYASHLDRDNDGRACE